MGVDRDGVDLWLCRGGKTQDPQNDFHVWISKFYALFRLLILQYISLQ